MSSDVAAQKAALRADIRARRRNRSAAERAAAASALRDVVLGLPELPAATVVAAYASTSTEPGTGPLLDALAARPGLRVLLPVQQADGGLDWAEYDASRPLVIGAHGIAEPAGPRLGPAAIASATVVVVPALAIDRRGNRLGQGGGGYDRALGELSPGALTVALVFADELVETLPRGPHDIAVAAAATPGGWHALAGA